MTLIGTIDAGRVVKKTLDAKGIGGRHLYAPMIIPGATHKASRIFVDEYLDSGISQPLPTGAGNRYRGVLVKGGLPGTALRQLARLGVDVADPYYLLLTGPEGARGGNYRIAFLGGLVALVGLLPLAAICLTKAVRRLKTS